MTPLQDRAAGALMGAFIGEALGVGPHWYYDLGALRRDHGHWISDYRAPLPGRYHQGLQAGDGAQPAFILKLLLQSLVDGNGYDHTDFCHRLDTQLLPLIDGSPRVGPGGYTSQSIRDAWHKRVEQQLPWDDCGGHADTTEAIERTLALAVRYATQPARLAETIATNAAITQTDDSMLAMTVAYGAVLGQLVQGHTLDGQISNRLMQLVEEGALPFHAVTTQGLNPPVTGAEPSRAGNFASPDALLTPSCMAQAALDAGVRIEPAWKVSLVYGMPCASYHVLPAVYYLAARFADDFESAVLHAINGGGQNQARAMLTGALAGAQCGLSGIPDRFIAGLIDAPELQPLCRALALQITPLPD
ncbi:ADP-ribosylglycohydrolase family protein [Oceanimonas sp. CHS3-5]|uniref:ADP-ribosylglycohydrolase family protein n=1 Tax=Oceanimonas sp. CHS3-5 TaxID=3068186 RepID=UPI00273D5FFA|nr:ADP-ribosylglycohydrolase family protein [Oceanimonas sp. CHS3-5]MDP5293308.1 ADP-ribosylglycohydrolase family protein [Oceanimonas sp. CHS3-5]